MMESFQARALTIKNEVHEPKKQANIALKSISNSLDSKLDTNFDDEEFKREKSKSESKNEIEQFFDHASKKFVGFITNDSKEKSKKRLNKSISVDNPKLLKSKSSKELDTIFSLDQEIEEDSEIEHETASLDNSTVNSEAVAVDEKCSCNDHPGKKLLDLKLDIEIELLYKTIFEKSHFNKKYWTTRKIKNEKFSEWTEGLPKTRTFQYTIDIGALGKASNTESQKLLENNVNKSIVVESLCDTRNVPYSDSFSVTNIFCMTRCTGNGSRLVIHTLIDFKKSVNFLVKGFIERNAFSNLRDCYAYLKANLPKVKPTVINEIKSENSETNDVNNSLVTDQVESDTILPNETTQLNEEINNESIHSEIDNQEDGNMFLFKHNLVRMFLILLVFLSIMNGALYFKLNNAELLIHKLKTNPEFEDLYPNDLNLVQSCRGPEDFNLKRKFNKMRSLLADSNKKLDKARELVAELHHELDMYEKIYSINND